MLAEDGGVVARPGSRPVQRTDQAVDPRRHHEHVPRRPGPGVPERVRRAPADEHHGAAACAKLREQYRVALVDEFQDTDPIQWEIMRRAFGEGDATLILIGDPKQAVY